MAFSREETGDDAVVPFTVPALHIRGRTVQLGAAVDEIITAHQYGTSLAHILTEAITLTALLGTNLKFQGKLILQTQTDGPVSLVICDYQAPGHLRACLKYDQQRLDQAISEDRVATEDLLGNGHLAMTMDQGKDMQRYQGIVAMDNCNFENAINQYFVQSEQISTFIRLTSAELSRPGSRTQWRGGGYMAQYLPNRADQAPIDIEESDDHWNTALALSETIQNDELSDPSVSPERLIYRLFHEFDPHVLEPHPVKAQCHCSQSRIETMLSQFSSDELADMADDGVIEVTCEFCNKSYAVPFEEPA